MSKIAVIAGAGALPLVVIRRLEEVRACYVVLSIAGYGPRGYESFHVGEIGKMLSYIKSNEVNRVVFCGAVKRPSLLSMKVDSVAKKWLLSLGARAFFGDDALMKGVRRLLEKEGIDVISPQSIVDSILAPKGILTTDAFPSEMDLRDIARGVFVMNSMSKADVGQAVVVQEGVILGVEAIEGTKNLVLRCKNLKISQNGGVLVKMAKIQQDRAIDLPAIGENTIFELLEAGFSGVAVESQNSQIIDFGETIKTANKNKIFIIGI